MNSPSSHDRVGTLSLLVVKAPGQRLGRTALMKLLFFLQELESIPLGYDFRLHTYGPYESAVLSDLATATVRGLLKESTVIYPRGYGYAITPGPLAERTATKLSASHPELVLAISHV